jgi:hypothetical protein
MCMCMCMSPRPMHIYTRIHTYMRDMHAFPMICTCMHARCSIHTIQSHTCIHALSRTCIHSNITWMHKLRHIHAFTLVHIHAFTPDHKSINTIGSYIAIPMSNTCIHIHCVTCMYLHPITNQSIQYNQVRVRIYSCVTSFFYHYDKRSS